MTPETPPSTIAAIVIAVCSLIAALAPLAVKVWAKAAGRDERAADKIEVLHRELSDIRTTQARCEQDRKADRRLLRWLILRVDGDRASFPPAAHGPLAQAFADLFADDTTDVHGAAE
jgi:hypothetical protein